MCKIGIIITVQEYRKKEFEDVKFAINDGDEIERIFLNTFQIPKDNILRYKNEEFTTTIAQTELQEFLNRLDLNSELYFYYAGHGFFYNGTNYLTTYDTLYDKLTTTALSVDDLFINAFKKSQAKTLVAFIDACASKTNDLNQRSVVMSRGITFEDRMLDSFDKFRLALYFACSPTERSYSWPEFKHGLWSKFLIDALNGETTKAFDKGKYISVLSLDRYLKEAIPGFLAEQKEKGYTQNPYSKIAGSHDWALVEFEENESFYERLDKAMSAFLAECQRINDIKHIVPDDTLNYTTASMICRSLEDITPMWETIILNMYSCYQNYLDKKEPSLNFDEQEALLSDIHKLTVSLDGGWIMGYLE